ncbi:MAG: hypothetical protein GC190_21820 [Alphaproteobacteria bacterium]|nr:hypothetical protein [Alphaproteobacteria bacterium]
MTLKTYQYTSVTERDDDTRWVAAHSEEQADETAAAMGWKPCGGLIFDERWTAEQLLVAPDFGGIDPDDVVVASWRGFDLMADAYHGVVRREDL